MATLGLAYKGLLGLHSDTCNPWFMNLVHYQHKPSVSESLIVLYKF